MQLFPAFRLVVELGLKIKDSIEKVGIIGHVNGYLLSVAQVRENKERLFKLGDDVTGTLSGLAKLTEGYEDAHPSPELYSALEGLKR